MPVPERSKESRGFGVSCVFHEDEREWICAWSHNSVQMVEHHEHRVAFYQCTKVVLCVGIKLM